MVISDELSENHHCESGNVTHTELVEVYFLLHHAINIQANDAAEYIFSQWNHVVLPV